MELRFTYISASAIPIRWDDLNMLMYMCIVDTSLLMHTVYVSLILVSHILNIADDMSAILDLFFSALSLVFSPSIH